MLTVVVVIAAMLSAAALATFWESGVCILCGGRGAHRDGCPEE